MTQAYNLAILANAVDTSGKLNVGTNATGTLPVANGGTGTSTPNLVAGTNISITGTWPNQTITNTATSASGTVTSVATGNGLQGGTITTSGTLSVACPSFNSVGSYCFIYCYQNQGFAAGTSLAAGTGLNQVTTGSVVGYFNDTVGEFTRLLKGSDAGLGTLSGTWRVMGALYYNPQIQASGTLACRIS